jgi:DNA repair exonuclease SbcCD ATPase subunit
LARKSHSEETERLQQDVQLLREDLNMAKVDLADNQSQLSQYRQEIECLRDQLDAERRAHEDADTEVEKRGEELRVNFVMEKMLYPEMISLLWHLAY